MHRVTIRALKPIRKGRITIPPGGHLDVWPSQAERLIARGSAVLAPPTVIAAPLPPDPGPSPETVPVDHA